MTIKSKIVDQLEQNYLFAVIRGKSPQEAYEISKAAYKGGIKNIEVTFTTPNAARAIEKLSEEYSSTDMIVGAGTVLDEVTARMAIMSGAQFIVSPHFSPEIAAMSNRYQIPYLPGCGSVTEVVHALERGVEIVKLFPGGVLGAGFIKDIHGPIPNVEVMPSGGVSLDNMENWMQNGAWAVGIGSALTKKLDSDGYESVTIEAKKFIDKYKEILDHNN